MQNKYAVNHTNWNISLVVDICSIYLKNHYKEISIYSVYTFISACVPFFGCAFLFPQNESCDANHGGTNMAITAVKTPTVPRDKWVEKLPRPKN